MLPKWPLVFHRAKAGALRVEATVIITYLQMSILPLLSYLFLRINDEISIHLRAGNSKQETGEMFPGQPNTGSYEI